MKQLLLIFILIGQARPSAAHHIYHNENNQKNCFSEIVSEKYIKGYQNYEGRWITGRVSVTRKKVAIPCHSPVPSSSRDQDCSAATGGLIGGGIAAAISEKDSYGWSIPLGAVLGMGINKERCS